ncbi:hypothetical protein OC844_006806 [Tilletia horrida]|nr:hypothetical protein OC844_006806 [Tilletia horrida]
MASRVAAARDDTIIRNDDALADSVKTSLSLGSKRHAHQEKPQPPAVVPSTGTVLHLDQKIDDSKKAPPTAAAAAARSLQPAERLRHRLEQSSHSTQHPSTSISKQKPFPSASAAVPPFRQGKVTEAVQPTGRLHERPSSSIPTATALRPTSSSRAHTMHANPARHFRH